MTANARNIDSAIMKGEEIYKRRSQSSVDRFEAPNIELTARMMHDNVPDDVKAELRKSNPEAYQKLLEILGGE